MTSTRTRPAAPPVEVAATSGSQTLLRGLEVLEAVADATIPLTALSERIGLTRSTTHRLASALIDKGYLAFTPRAGYRLGPKLLSLGALAQEQADIVQVAREHLEDLALLTEDTVHLGILDGDTALYLDKVPGRRRINISSRVGDRQPLTSTGLGKALMLDHPETYWLERLAAEQVGDTSGTWREQWVARMLSYVAEGRAYDLEENEDQIRCVSAAIRDARGRIVGAISVSSAAQYMNDGRMATVSDEVREAAAAISRDLGYVNRGQPGEGRGKAGEAGA